MVCGVGVEFEDINFFAEIMNCKSHKLPLKYLGLPLGASPRLKKTWKPVMDNFKMKLASWKRKLLSFGGRVTLIKSVLSSLTMYYLSLFRIPEGVAKQLERIQVWARRPKNPPFGVFRCLQIGLESPVGFS